MAERVGSIEIVEDMRFQEMSWRLQRVFWIVMAAILVAALVGLFGDGPLARAQVGTGEVGVVYERFARLEKVTRIEFNVRHAAPDGAARLRLARAFVENVEIEQIIPPPVRVVAVGGDCIYEFAGEPQQPLSVVFRVIPQHSGPLRCDASLNDADRLAFTLFVYP